MGTSPQGDGLLPYKRQRDDILILLCENSQSITPLEPLLRGMGCPLSRGGSANMNDKLTNSSYIRKDIKYFAAILAIVKQLMQTRPLFDLIHW